MRKLISPRVQTAAGWFLSALALSMTIEPVSAQSRGHVVHCRERGQTISNVGHRKSFRVIEWRIALGPGTYRFRFWHRGTFVYSMRLRHSPNGFRYTLRASLPRRDYTNGFRLPSHIVVPPGRTLGLQLWIVGQPAVLQRILRAGAVVQLYSYNCHRRQRPRRGLCRPGYCMSAPTFGRPGRCIRRPSCRSGSFCGSRGC